MLSVVIPTYNRRRTLADALDASLMLSESLDVEFIIVNDGSSDDTAAYLEDLSARQPRVTSITTPNGGPGAARNIGASKAKGEIILFMGDDTKPTSAECFATHIRLHTQFPDQSTAVLGKVIWPQQPGYPISFVMSLIQGEGGQQFGYAHMRPYARYDWRFFYTANVSLKRSCVDNWLANGFSPDFRSYGYEDGELAFRLTKKFGKFDVLYAPTSVVAHDHQYSVASFLNRQVSAGWMTNTFVALHPDAAGLIGVAELRRVMEQHESDEDRFDRSELLAVIEGIFASAKLLERSSQIGSSAWHTSFINAVFELAYLRGAVWGHENPAANRTAGYRYALNRFDSAVAMAVERECLASVAPFTYTHKKKLFSRSSRVKSFLRNRLASFGLARSMYRRIKRLTCSL